MKELTPEILNRHLNVLRRSLMLLMYFIFASALIYTCSKSGEYFSSVIGSTIGFAFLSVVVTLVGSVIVDKKIYKLISDKIIKKEDINPVYKTSLPEVILFMTSSFFLYGYCLIISTKGNNFGALFETTLSIIFVAVALSLIKNIGRLVDAPVELKSSQYEEYIFSSPVDIAHSNNWHSDPSHPGSVTNPMSPNFPHWFNI